MMIDDDYFIKKKIYDFLFYFYHNTFFISYSKADY